MSVQTRVGCAMCAIFCVGGVGAIMLGPPDMAHAIPSAVIAVIGSWGGIAMLMISLKEKPHQGLPERRISGEIRVINEQTYVETKRRPPQG